MGKALNRPDNSPICKLKKSHRFAHNETNQMKKLTFLAVFLVVMSACNKEMPPPPDSDWGYEGDFGIPPSDPNYDPSQDPSQDPNGNGGDDGNYSNGDGSDNSSGDGSDDGSGDGSGDPGGGDSGGRYKPRIHHSGSQPIAAPAGKSAFSAGHLTSPI